MAWYDKEWLYRAPLTFANHSGVAAPDGEITIPKAMGKFWAHVQSNFNDVRITEADGVTPIDWAFSGGTPSATNKTCTIQIDAYPVQTNYSNDAASASVGAFLYWGNDDTNLTSNANNSITISSAKTVLADLNDPNSASTNYVLKCYKPEPDQVYPTHRIRKQVNDNVKLYWDLSDCVMRLRRHSENSTRGEEIAYVKAQIFDQDGSDTTAAMTTLNSITIGENHVVQMPITAGTHEKRYIIIMTFGLVDDAGTLRVLDQRATLLVENLGLHPS